MAIKFHKNIRLLYIVILPGFASLKFKASFSVSV